MSRKHSWINQTQMSGSVDATQIFWFRFGMIDYVFFE